MGDSPGELSEELVTKEKRKKGWRMTIYTQLSTVACKLIRTRHIFTFSVIVGLTAAHTALIDICSTCNSIVEGRSLFFYNM